MSAAFTERHKRSLLFLLAALALAGVASSVAVPVALFPNVTFPRIVVSMEAGDRPAERMELEVTRVVEQAVRAVPKVEKVRSVTTRGSAEVSASLAWGSDMVSATLQVESALNQIRSELPANTTIEVRRMDPTVFPVVAYSLTSKRHSLAELRAIAEVQIRPALSTVEGIASVAVLGGDVQEVQVTLRADRLSGYGLTIAEVADALRASNVVSGVGRLQAEGKLYLELSNTELTSLDDVRATVISTGTNGFVRLDDIANVSLGAEPQWTRVTADGQDAVIFQVHQQIGGNTVQISNDVAAEIARLRSHLPSELVFSTWYDQSDLITASARSVRDAVLFGMLLAALVLFAFLRNWRLTFIASLAVPVVMATTVLVLYMLGMSLNIMTMGGMAAAVGLVVDDAIVMTEHIVRRLAHETGKAHEIVLRAAREMTIPLTGSSASTIVIFLPLAFLGGVTGAFFKALSLTMAIALAVSFIFAWLAVPVLSQSLLRGVELEDPEIRDESALPQRIYRRLLAGLLSQRWLVMVIALVFLGLGYASYQRLGSGFMPAMDEGGFTLDYRGPPGTSLEETDRILRQLENILQTTPEIESYSRRTGLQLGGGVTEADEGDFFIRLRPLPRRDVWAVMDDVRTRAEVAVPALAIEMPLLIEDLIGDLTAVPQPIEVKLYGNDQAVLGELATKVAEDIGKVEGLVDISDGVILAGDALDIQVDRELAALEGMTPQSVTDVLTDELEGSVVPGYLIGVRIVGLRIWLGAEERNSVADIARLPVRAPDGHVFPLSRVAKVQRVSGQPQLTRDNLERMVAVTGRISGRDMGGVAADVRRILDGPGYLPEGVYYRLGGLYAEQQSAFRGLLMVLIAAVVLVFLVLLFLYESFLVVFAVLITTLLAVTAVLTGLFVTGTELNISAMMGMTMVIGIVTEVAIFYLAEYQEQEQLSGDARLIAAGVHRMRAIAMTTLAAMFALIPLALGIGEGAAMQQPLAIAIVSGLAVQLPLVLLVLPALLSIFGVERRVASDSE